MVLSICSRTPPGVRELKQKLLEKLCKTIGSRTPPGVRELKHTNSGVVTVWDKSHPSRGA